MRLLTGSQACAAGGRKSKRVEQEKTQSNASGNEQCDNVFDRMRRWFKPNRGSQERGSHQGFDGGFLLCENVPLFFLGREHIYFKSGKSLVREMSSAVTHPKKHINFQVL